MGRSDFHAVIATRISEETGELFTPDGSHDAGGGCINRAIVLEDGSRRYFVKLNQASRLAMFIAEAAGLAAIADSNTVRVPKPVCHDTAAGQAYLVMEYLPLQDATHTSMAQLGTQLAAMHRHTQERFGWDVDNTIGSTPQLNDPDGNWVQFLRTKRLGYQLTLAAERGYGGPLQRQGERLLEQLDLFFTDYHPTASLLHGDLWGGNASSTRGDIPVIFDPAVYFGDRESDLAMTELFGGFPDAFYRAYRDAWPLDAGYDVRRDLYNLYHVLNHLNLFGGGYAGQAQHLIDGLLAELR